MDRNTSAPGARTQAHGFSLVELLVVIGIISLLIGIALPAFSRAKEAAKVTTTTATINAIGTGMELFRADTKFGGEYPPSDRVVLPANPHLPDGVVKPVAVSGANLAVYALAGADLLGSAGIRDTNYNGLWADDLNAQTKAPYDGLYRLDNRRRARTPLIDISKMRFPKNIGAANDPVFEIPAGRETIPSLTFLDSFDQPILYYRANPGMNVICGYHSTVSNQWIYDMGHNAAITGVRHAAFPPITGLNFGSGTGHFPSRNPNKGNVLLLPEANLLNPQLRDEHKGTFAHTILNPGVATVARPHNAETFILLSAGPDGLFGTEDDIANFPTNK